MATTRDLMALREELDTLRSTLAVLRRIDAEVPAGIEPRIAELSAVRLDVEVTCVICQRTFVHPTEVDDPEQSVPTACLCASCDIRIGARMQYV